MPTPTADRPPLQLVVFDVAGTTVNDPGAVNACLRAALASAGVEASRSAVDAVMGLPKPEAIRILVEQAGALDRLAPALATIHDDFEARMLAFYRQDPSVVPVPGIEALFDALKARGIRRALDTGFGHTITASILERLRWDTLGRIDAHVSSDQVPRGRPHPDMIRHLMAGLGVTDPRAVAKVGDAPADLQEGTNAGCPIVIGVTWGTHTRSQLAPFPHTDLVDTIAELSDRLLG